MNTENQILQCPYCGGEIQHSPNQGGIEKHNCVNCGYEFYIENENSREKMFALNAFRNEVINLLHAKIDGGKAENIKNWKKNEKQLEEYIEQCGGESNQDPLFAIARVAHLTDGFEQYPASMKSRNAVKGLYKIAKKYACKNKKAINISELVSLYEDSLLKPIRKKWLLISGGALGLLMTGFIIWAVIMGQKVPVFTDPNTGVTVTVPSDAVSIFEKTGIGFHVEKQPTNSVAYIDAKDALHNETEKFELYDLALLNGQKALDFDGSVTVEIPIPEGYFSGALKVYHVISDDEYNEIPSTVSKARNTISFKTTHFSYYAVAERHPIVVFDTDGAGEIDRQIVQRDTLAQKPEDPQKEGYTFAGWMVGNEMWNFATNTVKKDMVLKAKWVPNEYTITLVADGAVLPTEAFKITYMDTYSSLPTNVTKAGFTFVGWYTAPEQGRLITNDMIMQTAADQTLYAVFTKNTNTVIFDPNGGSGEMADLELKTENTARLPKNTFTKVGYTFVGWSTSKTGDVVFNDNAEYTMGTSVTNTLYAVWQINTNTLRFDANGGEGSMELIQWDYNTTHRLPQNTFVRLGYTFIGWSTSQNGDVAFADKAEYTMAEKGEYILYAQWQINRNKLHFEPNGGSGSMSYVEAAYNDFFHLPPNQFYREGYTFIGWSMSPVGEKMYGDEAEYRMGADSDYTLYALWKGNQNAFVFHANGGDGHMPTDFVIATGGTENLPLNQFTRNGYTFVGWSTDAHGAVKYADGVEYTQTTAKTVELYAVWQIIDYTITFEVNGGSNIPNKNYTVEDAFSFLHPTKIGYDFAGWYESAEFAGDAVDGIVEGDFGNKTYHAKWVAIDYEIIYESNGGSYIDPQYYDIETTISNLPKPTKVGYVFAGWYQNSDFSGESTTAIETGTYGNIQLYAKWNVITYTVTFEVNGGNDVASITYTIESEGFALTNPVKLGYTFDGWYKDNTFLTDAVDYVPQGSHNDMTLYAKWSCDDYTIQYESNGGSDISETVYTIETETFSLKAPTKTGYTFAGWYDNDTFEGAVITSIEKGSTGDKILYAKWTPITYTITFDSKGGSDIVPITYNIESETFDLPTPTRTGYDFVGWYSNVACAGDSVSTIYNGTYENVILYAKWESVKYEIVFESNGGSYVPSVTYNIESNSFNLSIPQKQGYEFLGWYADEAFSGDKVETIAQGSIGNRTYYAKWSAPIEYTITFYPNGGSEVATISYTVLSETFYLPVSTRVGYEFAGWYKQANLTGNSVSAIYQGTHEHIVLYANWTATTYTVEFDTNGGEPIPNGSYNITVQYTLPTPQRTGYTFLGWYDNESLTGDAVEVIPQGSIENKCFWAKWQANHYTVTYHPNDGVGTMETSNHVYDVVQALTANSFAKDHYEFAGWGLSKDGPVVYSDKDEVVNLTSVHGGNVDLYAQWTPKTYTITFNTNGGEPLADIEYTIETETFELPKAIRKGFRFGGWYEDGRQITTIPKDSYGDKNLYCGEWKSAHIFITLDLGGGTMTGSTFIKCTLDPDDPDIANGWIHVDDIVWPTPEWYIYPEYNHFEGWIDKDANRTFNSDTDPEAWKTMDNPPTELDLQATWNKLDAVYEGVSQLPETFNSDRVLINLSNHSGTTACDKNISIQSATEVIFIGHESATYTNLGIFVNAVDKIDLVFVDFNMTGSVVGNSHNATIICYGDCSVLATSTSAAAITGFVNLGFAGDGKLIVKGKDGDTGENGGIGIQVTDTLTLSDGVKLTIYGGNGGSGKDQPQAKEGKNGADGGNAGNGATALIANIVSIESGTLDARGGNGGNGGKGGNGNNDDEWYGTKYRDGGDGGDGGAGSYAIYADSIIGINGTLNVVGGNGGSHGVGGNPGGKEGGSYRGDPGKPGDSGDGCSACSSVPTVSQGFTIISTDGVDGT